MSDDGWQERALARVEDYERNRATTKLKRIWLTDDMLNHVYDAAELRGMSVTAYMRRSVMAMAAYDLGLEWDEVMAEEGPVRKHGYSATYDKTPARGQGFGGWTIDGVR